MRSYIDFYVRRQAYRLPKGSTSEDFLVVFDEIVVGFEKHKKNIPPKVWAGVMLALGGQLKKENKWPEQKQEQSATSPTKS